uniref:Uncharacterized protein n=1 Tax=Ditylenchus dipsaci TaxID=166011 RepID=A0A915ER01_9BILA
MHHHHQFYEVGANNQHTPSQKISPDAELLKELDLKFENIDWEDDDDKLKKQNKGQKKHNMHSTPTTTFWLDDSTNIFVLDSGRKKSNDMEEDERLNFEAIEKAAEAAQRVERHKGQKYSSPVKASTNFTFI